MKYEEGLVSVVIPTYKRADKLLRTLESVCNQTYKKMEIFVINDNDNNDEYTAELEKIMSGIKDTRVKLVYQEKHINGAAARNVGIKKSKGEYIAFIDDDDYWDKEKIAKQVKVFKTLDSSYGAVSTMYKTFLDGKIISKSQPYKDGLIWENILLRRCEVLTSSVVVRHTALDETGYFDENLYRHQEIQLLSYLTHKYKIRLLDEYLLFMDAWGENNPSPEKLIKIKQDFFKSVEPLMLDLPLNRRNRVMIMHNFELAFVYFRNKQLEKCLRYALPIFRSPFTLYYALERVLLRLKSKRV